MAAENPLSRTYRATAEAWFGRFLLPFAFGSLLVITAVNTGGFSPLLATLLLMALSLGGVFGFVLPMLRDFLRLDERGLEGSFGGRNFRIYWTEVLAAWVVERNRKRFLCLGMREGTAIIPLHYFDAEAVWGAVRAQVPPESLDVSAVKRLPDYQQWVTARENLVADDARPRRTVDHWVVQIFGWGGMTMGVLASVEAYTTGQYARIVVYALVAVVMLTRLLDWGITEFNADGVRRRTLLGTKVIRWDDVRWMEMDPLETTLVLGGYDRKGKARQLVVSGPVLWLGAGKDDVLNLLLAQSQHRQIEMRRTPSAMFKFSKNVKAKVDKS